MDDFRVGSISPYDPDRRPDPSGAVKRRREKRAEDQEMEADEFVAGTADDEVGAAAAEPAAEADAPPIDPTEPTADAAPVSVAPAEETSELLPDAGCACKAADIAPAIVPPEVWFLVGFLVGSAAGAPSSAPRRDRRESVFDLAAFADPFVAAAAGGLILRTEPAPLARDSAADGAAGRQIVEVAAELR